jgi:FkbM family methyltransferase
MNATNIYHKLKNKFLFRYDQALPYYSQDGQDKYIHTQFFRNKRKGFFVDIGANDGITLSNTNFFEKELGWEGICIEPNPDTFKRLLAARKCITLNGAISNHSDKATFLKITGHSEMLSGLIDFYDDEHLRRIDEELKLYGGEKQEISVKCYKLNELFESYKVKNIDYMSIDTEGGEYNIIETIDFKKISISVISIENPYNDARIRKLLFLNDFELNNILGSDEIYKNKKHTF